MGRRGPGRKRLDHGGLLIGVVGGDGAGKSTAVEAVVEHLSKDFATRRIHMGKPPWSRASRLIRRPMRKARAAGAFQSTRLPPWADFDDIGFPGFGYLLWHTLIARDRFLEYRRARGAANDGAIVVSDRYPLDSIRLMDGRRIDRLPGIAGRPLAGLLRRVESSYYSRILPPDLVIVLRATPDVAAGRRLDDPEEFVRRRSTEVLEADWSGIASVVIDAGLPMDKVQAHVREAIWSTL